MKTIKFACLVSLFAFAFCQPEPSVNTTLHFTDSPLTDIVWCGNKKNVVFFLTEKNRLYRSVDDGFNGHTFTEDLQELGKNELVGSKSPVGKVSSIIKNPIDSSLLLFVGTEGVSWITEDCGGSFRAIDQGRYVEEFKFHPTERNWLLYSAWTICEDFDNGEPCKKFKELFLSKNLGGDWELVANYVYQFSWGRVDNNFFRVPKERIIIAYDQAAKDHQDFKNWHDKIQITYSDDFFKTNTSILPRSSKFLVTSYFIFAVQHNDDDSQEITLYVGDTRVRNYTLRPIEIPVKRLMEHSYTILDTADHSVFLHISHEGEQSFFGNVYVSDSTGVRYSASLSGSSINANGQYDFGRVLGLEGIYLANVIDRDARKRFKNLDVNEFPQQQASKGKGGSGPKDTSLEKAKTALHDFKQTVISFNKGGIWQPLVPPERDVDGNRIKCLSEEECQLHLHSISNTNFGPFYTTENSLGMILGTGNIGKYLSNKADEINTYLSRDGGLTWFEIAKGSHIYEIGDHGSIIVIAPDQHATKEIKYSWNEGLTWETLKISDVPIEVTNIIIEPTNTAEKFLVYGRESGQQKRGAVIAVDFTPIHQRECKGVENPDTPDSDYETWSPNGKISPHCLLGKQVTYTRRRRDAECFNKEDHDRWRYVNRCQCTEDDWECDFGYVRIGTGPCLAMDKKMEETTRAAPPPAECDGSYSITQGYRKVGGNSCDGGINHDPIKIPCPMVITKETQNMIALLALSVVAVGLLWKGSNNGTVDRVKSYLGGFKNNFTSKLTRFKKDDDKDKGFQRLGGEPGSMADEENEFGRIEFEDNEDGNEIVYGDDAQDQQNVRKRMTERRAIETANKRVPTLNRPGEKKGSSGVNLLE